MKNYLFSQLVIVLGLIVFPLITCLGADYYQFDIKQIPCLKSFTLASSEIEMAHGIVSRTLIVENPDDRVFIKLCRSLSDTSGEEAYRMLVGNYGAPKSPVDVGDEAVKIGLGALVFKCGPYVGSLRGLSKHSRIAMREVDGSTVVKLTARDLKVSVLLTHVDSSG